MQTIEKTIDHGTLRRLVDAGARVEAEVVAGREGWGVVIDIGRSRQTLAATRGGSRTFRRFETLAAYLKVLGIVEYRVNAAAFDPDAPCEAPADRRSVSASQRMKRAHEAAAYDEWFREQIRASIDDPRPSVDDTVARRRLDERRQLLIETAVRRQAAKAHR